MRHESMRWRRADASRLSAAGDMWNPRPSPRKEPHAKISVQRSPDHRHPQGTQSRQERPRVSVASTASTRRHCTAGGRSTAAWKSVIWSSAGSLRTRIAGSRRSLPIRRSTSKRSTSSPRETSEACTATSSGAGRARAARSQRATRLPLAGRQSQAHELSFATQRRSRADSTRRDRGRTSSVRASKADGAAPKRGRPRQAQAHRQDLSIGEFASPQANSPQARAGTRTCRSPISRSQRSLVA